ncbi:MAG TPA: hypothetical protein VGM83_03050 [Devosiaceae bacterium]|jgi:hypothetical protein
MDITVWLAYLGLTSPPLQAAAIQGGFALIGIVLTGLLASFAYGRNRAADRRVQRLLREEKTRDLQGALRAEARAHWYELNQYGQLDAICESVVQKIENGRWTQPPYTPFVVKQVQSILFDAIERDIALLDHDVIRVTVDYFRQLSLATLTAEDLRTDRFAALPADRKIEMVRSYYGVLATLKNTAARLNARLEDALKLKSRQRDANMPYVAQTSLAVPGMSGSSAAAASGPASALSATARLNEP